MNYIKKNLVGFISNSRILLYLAWKLCHEMVNNNVFVNKHIKTNVFFI